MSTPPRLRKQAAVALALATFGFAGCSSSPPPARPLGLQRAELVPMVSRTQDDIAIVDEGEGSYYWKPRTDMMANAVFIWNQATPSAAVAATASPDEREALLIGTVYFDTNSSVLTSRARRALDRLPESDRISIVSGHADVRGSNGLNDPLSQRRANAVADYLRSKGSSVGAVNWHGARQPAATLQESRRAEMWQDAP